MESIENNREKLNTIDSKIIKLLEERFAITKEIAFIKKEYSLPITDEKREGEIINRLASETYLKKNIIEDIYNKIFFHSKSQQYNTQKKKKIS